MTIDEYRAALNELTPDQLLTFCANWGGGSASVEECVKKFTFAENTDPAKWDRIAVYYLRSLGVEGVRTEAEKAIQLAEKSADAAQVSARAALRSADSAAGSNRAAWWSQIIALLAIVATIAIERKC